MIIVQLLGHLGKDPEVRVTPASSGAGERKVTSFTMACNHRKSKDETVTVWVRVTVWGDKIERMLPYLKKGSAVIVTGKLLPPNVYTDKNGVQQVSLDVTAEMVEFSPFGKSDKAGAEGGAGARPSSYSQSQNFGAAYDPASFQSVSGGSYNPGFSSSSMSHFTAESSLAADASHGMDDNDMPF